MSIDLTAELLNESATAVVDEIESAAATAGELPPGKYPARLEGAQQKELGGLSTWELLSLVTAGPYKGRKVRYSLWMGTKETDKDGNQKTPEQIEEAKKRIRNEFWHAAGVMGLAVKVPGPNGKPVYKFAPNKRDFRDVLGAEFVVKTKLRAYTTQSGEERKGSEVEQFGVFAFGDPKVKEVTKPAPGSVPPPAASPVAGSSEDLSDLAEGV
jgi:hypothetical protein